MLAAHETYNVRHATTLQVLLIDALDEADAAGGGEVLRALSNPLLRLLADSVAGRLVCDGLPPGSVRVVVTSRCLPAVWTSLLGVLWSVLRCTVCFQASALLSVFVHPYQPARLHATSR